MSGAHSITGYRFCSTSHFSQFAAIDQTLHFYNTYGHYQFWVVKYPFTAYQQDIVINFLATCRFLRWYPAALRFPSEPDLNLSVNSAN